MRVDLLDGIPPPGEARHCTRISGGICVQRCGHRFYSLAVGPDEDGEIEVRIENGVYMGYTRDGLICHIEVSADGRKHWARDADDASESPVDIVEFIRCPWDDPRAKGLSTEGRI